MTIPIMWEFALSGRENFRFGIGMSIALGSNIVSLWRRSSVKGSVEIPTSEVRL